MSRVSVRFMWLVLVMAWVLVACGGGGLEPPVTEAPVPTEEVTPTVAAPVEEATPTVTAPAEEVTPVIESESILGVLEASGNYTIFLDLIAATADSQLGDLGSYLAEAENVTLFAVSDISFSNWSQEDIDAWKGDTEWLATNMWHHVVEGASPFADLLAQGSAPSVAGGTLGFHEQEDGTMRVNFATLVSADLPASNGYIHEISWPLRLLAWWEEIPPPDDLMEEVEVWIPYEPGQVLPIGDAELAAEPEMREAVAALYDVLLASGATINTARTVVLWDDKGTTFLAPAGPLDLELAESVADQTETPQSEDAVILGAWILTGEEFGDYGPGPFLTYVTGLSDGTPQLHLVDADGTILESIDATPEDIEVLDESEVPTAAIFFGSRWCRYVIPFVGVWCNSCSGGPFSSKDACQAR